MSAEDRSGIIANCRNGEFGRFKSDFPSGYDVPIQIEQMKDQYPTNDKDQAWTDDFVTIEEQIEERKEKVAENQPHTYPEPTGSLARIRIDLTNRVPKGFFGNVRAIDQEVLRKANVGPENREGKGHAGQIILVSLLVKSLE